MSISLMSIYPKKNHLTYPLRQWLMIAKLWLQTALPRLMLRLPKYWLMHFVPYGYHHTYNYPIIWHISISLMSIYPIDIFPVLHLSIYPMVTKRYNCAWVGGQSIKSIKIHVLLTLLEPQSAKLFLVCWIGAKGNITNQINCSIWVSFYSW